MGAAAKIVKATTAAASLNFIEVPPMLESMMCGSKVRAPF
jgi:hypothetical protein